MRTTVRPASDRGSLRVSRRVVISLSALLILGCESDNPIGPSDQLTVRVNFSMGQQGWTAGFADYPVGQEAFFELESDYRPLPPPLDTSQHALYISGNNHSDDLFMYYTGRHTGLQPTTRYLVRFSVEFATNAPSGCAGVGGSPGESVYVKAGASELEPDKVVVNGYYRMNISKGEQSTSGEDAITLGDVANSVTCGEGVPRWELKDLSSVNRVEVTTGTMGDVWLLVRTDSGFEATSSLYYTRFVASFSPVRKRRGENNDLRSSRSGRRSSIFPSRR